MARPEHRFAEFLTRALEYLSMAIVTIMALLVIAQVIFRYVLNDPLDWSEELARFCFIYLAFIGIGAAYGRRRHMFVDALVIELPPRFRRIVEVSVVGLATAFLVAVIGITGRTILDLYRMEVTTPALDMPMAYIYLVIPLGLAALIAQMWLDLYKEKEALMILLFGMMLVFILLGMELGTAMGFSGMVYILYSWLGPSPIPLSIIPQNFMHGLDSFPLLAVPLFMLAGELMEKGGVTERLVRFARALVGHITGGLANVSVVVNMIMAGMSGSSVADAAATGTILIPAMKKAKYPPEMAAAVIASSATIGPIIPPSIPFVLIGSMTGVSIGRLFLGGAVPGVLMGVMLLITTYLIARKRKMAKDSEFKMKELLLSTRDAILCLLMPVVVLGTMVFGIATPTEAAGIAVAYALFLGGVIYREFTWASLVEALRNSAVTTASITFTIAGASVIGWVATAEQIGPKLAQAFLAITDNPLLIMFMINILILLLGFPLEPLPMIMMLIPILMPVVKQLGIDPVHFIVVFTVNIQLALLTPPVGANLFVVTAIAKSTILDVSRALIPFLIALLVALVILIAYPPLTLWLPKALMG